MPTDATLGDFRIIYQRSDAFEVHFGGQKIVSSSSERSFHLEFHTLIERLRREGVDGVEMVDWHLAGEGKDFAKGLASQYLESEGIVVPQGGPLFQRKVVENLFRDLMLMAGLRCPGGVESLHSPVLGTLVDRTPGVESAPGFLALESEVPGIASLPWERVNELR